MTVLKITKPTLEEYLNEMLKGLQSDLPSTVKSITLNGKIVTPALAQAQITALLPLFVAVDAAKAPYTQAVAARKAVEPEGRLLLNGLRTFVRQLFPGDLATQAKFGVIKTPRKARTSLQKATSSAKATSTKSKKKAAAPPPEAQLVFGSASNTSEPATAPAAAPVATPGGK